MLNPAYPAQPRPYPVLSAVNNQPRSPLNPVYIERGCGGVDTPWADSPKEEPISGSARRNRDTPHSRADPECPRCKETRTFYAHVSPDPQRRGPARVEREAAHWLQSHPCTSTIYAHPRRKDKAA